MALSATSAERLAHARLSGTASLRIFRALLDAASRPGTIARLPGRRDDIPAVLYPALALVDLDHRVAVLGDGADSEWPALVCAATGASADDGPDGIGHADVVVYVRPPTPDEITTLRRGTASAPEQGARLVVAARAISEEPPPVDGSGASVELRGPGVAGSRTVAVDGIGDDVFAALADVNRDFPAGVDTWIVADDGSVVAVPRSTRLERLTDDRKDH
ncbi:MAG: phosphonate C-P lyase system protein PhnH [Actinomycetota bacterium]